ncbi:MAG: amidohydrolase family protein [Actinomycetes bacterium]
MLDYLIKGAIVVDGTGADRFVADVGFRDGRIDAVGVITEDAAVVIDATGLVLCPGFVDPHTHYDAQLFWDPMATPSSLHGVTSIVAGNCGFTLAPVSGDGASYLIDMMARVEGMPKDALEQGVPWDWNSFGEYLDRLDGNLGVNAAFLVGHCALRREVMGEDAVGHEATPAQIDQMRVLLAEALNVGGLGFSTTQSFTHSDGDGDPVPSRWATPEELLTLCDEVAAHEGTTLEWVTDGCLSGFEDQEIDLMIDMSLRAQRPINWNVLTVDSAVPERSRDQLAASVEAERRGARVVALTMPTLVGMNMSFLTYCALHQLPNWGAILSLPITERMARLAEPATRISMEQDANSPEAGVFGRLTGWGRYRIGDTFSSANEGLKGRLVADIARERGVREFFALLDIVAADDLQTVLWPGPTDDDSESWRMRVDAWRSGYAMLGGSDAGAHLDRMCGAPYTTEFLGDCLRGKQLMGLEEAIHHLTDMPARLFGLRDRGRITEGWIADVVLFDPNVIDSGDVVMVHDLPGGSGRLSAEAIGIAKVFVNGELSVDANVPTGVLAGTILKSGRDTDTVLVGNP